MSGNSSFRRLHTAPIVRGRSLELRIVEVAMSSVVEEGEAVLADLDLVPVLELGVLDSPPVDVRAVKAAEILDRGAVIVAGDERMAARDGDVVEEDVAFRRSADHHPLAVE